MKDWTGNSRSSHALLGARNYALEDRQEHDYYATEPKALELLLDQTEVQFSNKVWECASGGGYLAEVLKNRGYDVLATDLYEYGYGISGIDFLTQTDIAEFDGDIVTNPPYKYATEFVQRAYDIVTEGHKVAMFLKIQYLEGKERRKKLYDVNPPKLIYVSSSRLHCAMNGDFEKYSKSNAVCYAWFIWEKGYKGETIVRWFN